MSMTRRTAAAVSTASVVAAIAALSIVVANSGDSPATKHGTSDAAAAPAAHLAAPATTAVTVATIKAALARADHTPQTDTSVLTRGSATVSKQVTLTPSTGTPSDTYYDAGTTLLTRTGATADGTVVVVDYIAKQWYPQLDATLPGTDHSWITNGLDSGALTLSGSRITGKDKFGSPVVITLDPSTNLPTTSTIDQPAGRLTDTYQWTTGSTGLSGSATTAAAAASIDRQAIVTAPAGFKHLAHAPETGVRAKGLG